MKNRRWKAWTGGQQRGVKVDMMYWQNCTGCTTAQRFGVTCYIDVFLLFFYDDHFNVDNKNNSATKWIIYIWNSFGHKRMFKWLKTSQCSVSVAWWEDPVKILFFPDFDFEFLFSRKESVTWDHDSPNICVWVLNMSGTSFSLGPLQFTRWFDWIDLNCDVSP